MVISLFFSCLCWTVGFMRAYNIINTSEWFTALLFITGGILFAVVNIIYTDREYKMKKQEAERLKIYRTSLVRCVAC